MRTPRLRTDERGAVLVIVAVFALVAVAMLAAVIDLGDLRQEKKEVTLSTDAAALAGVSMVRWTDSSLALNTPVDCNQVDVDKSVFNSDPYSLVSDVVAEYLSRNGGTSALPCEVVRTGRSRGYVVVRGTEFVDYKVAAAPGSSVSGVSVAAIDRDGVGGLYPIGLCKNDGPEAHLGDMSSRSWEGTPSDPYPVITFDFGNFNCGASGNHGQVDFEGNPPPGLCPDPPAQGNFCTDLVARGYNGPTPTEVGSNPGGGGWTPVEDYINPLVNSGTVWVPVLGEAFPESISGNYARYPVVKFAEAMITRFEASGSGAGIDFEIRRIIEPASFEILRDEDIRPRLCAMTSASDDLAANCLGSDVALPDPTPEDPEVTDCVAMSADLTPGPVLNEAKPGELSADIEAVIGLDESTSCEGIDLRVVKLSPDSATVVATFESQAPRSVSDTAASVTFKKKYASAEWTEADYRLEAFVGDVLVGSFDFSLP
jgi:hypothetical protein